MWRIFPLYWNLLFTLSSLQKGHASRLFLFLLPYDSCKLIAGQCKENNKCRTMRVWIKAPLPPTTTHPSPSLVGEQEIKHFLALSYPEIYFVIMIIKVIFWHKGYLVWHKILPPYWIESLTDIETIGNNLIVRLRWAGSIWTAPLRYFHPSRNRSHHEVEVLNFER